MTRDKLARLSHTIGIMNGMLDKSNPIREFLENECNFGGDFLDKLNGDLFSIHQKACNKFTEIEKQNKEKDIGK